MSYKVDEIAWDKTPQDTFTNAKGENVSFVDYYKNQYGLEVLDPKQPLLVSTVYTWNFTEFLITKF